jgi:N-acetylglucosaminyl-diphospho-decaprenol L-rhamnosyltransferase
MTQTQITVIIVTYRSRDTIGPTLDALRESHEAGLIQCVVVDNHSGDDTLDFVAKEHPWARCVDSGENAGFGAGCNRGMPYVDTPYVLFLNPDAVIQRDALTRLCDFMDVHPDVGIVGPAIRSGAYLQHAGGLPSPRRVIEEALGRSNDDTARRRIQPGEAAFETDWICGAVFFVRTRVLKEVGAFDPRFFLYFEESDLCKRILDGGYRIWAVGESVADHLVGNSTKQSKAKMFGNCIAEYFFESRFYYNVKHQGWLWAATAELVEVAIYALRALRHRSPDGHPGRQFRERWAAPILSQPPIRD